MLEKTWMLVLINGLSEISEYLASVFYYTGDFSHFGTLGIMNVF